MDYTQNDHRTDTPEQTSQVEQPQGNFIGFAANPRYKREGDRKPNFTGRIAVPGAKDEFDLALWAGTDKNGRVMFTGSAATISRDADVHEQIAQMAGVGSEARRMEENGIELRPGQMVLFANGYKDAENPNRPDYYGRWNPGKGQKLVTISAWARKSDKGQALLTGQTQYAISKEAALSIHAPDDGLSVDATTGEILEPTQSRARKSRGSR